MLFIIGLFVTFTIVGCAITGKDKEPSSFNQLMDEVVDLIAFVSVDEAKDYRDEQVYTLKIEELVFNKGESTEETIELYLEEGFIHDDTTYLLFARKVDDFYYRADENSLILGVNDTYDVRMPHIGGRYSREAFIDEMKLLDETFFVKLELYLAAAGTYLDHFPKNITISNNGDIKVYTEEIIDSVGEVELEVGPDAPVIEKKISSEEVAKIKKEIKRNRFHSLPHNVTDYQVQDGSGSRITLYQEGKVKSVGGDNSNHEQYNAIEKVIFDYVKDEYCDWEKETREYLEKLNEF